MRYNFVPDFLLPLLWKPENLEHSPGTSEFQIICSTKYALGGLNGQDFLAWFPARVEHDGAVGNLKSMSLSGDFDKNWLSLGTPGLENEKNCNKRLKISGEGDHFRSREEMGKSIDHGGELLRGHFDQNSPSNRHWRQNLNAERFDPQTFSPLYSFQVGRDINQMSLIPVKFRSKLRNNVHILEDRLTLQNSATSSSASTTLKDFQYKDQNTLFGGAQNIIDIPETARSQGLNENKDTPIFLSKASRTPSSGTNKHYVADLVLSQQHATYDDKNKMPTFNTFQINTNERLIHKSEKTVDGVFYGRAYAGRTSEGSNLHLATARNGKNIVIQNNRANNFASAKVRAPKRKRNKKTAVKAIGTVPKSGYEHDLLKLLDLGTPLIQLDLIKEFEMRAKYLNRKQTALSIIQILCLVEDQIKEHGGTEFFVTDAEVLKFLGSPTQRNFVINYSNSEFSRDLSSPKYATELKKQLQDTDLSSLVIYLSSASGINSLPFFPLNQWKKIDKSLENEDRMKKSIVGKLFLIYSIIINKIFCDGPADKGFIDRQAKAVEFYHCLFHNTVIDGNGNSLIQEDEEKNDLIKSENYKKEINFLVKGFNDKYTRGISKQSRYQFWMVWNLIELWLIQSRNELYKTLRNNTQKLVDNFKPFINNIVYTLLELNSN
ncbi:hypothetical protein BY996DRAFT_6740111 [Phakopsora pachyrhizi]|uniref:Uncharacterized protein n=1 Tax=Phakopsora pachyrhizi TaxID=170000 RepID=A0AAV0AM65_PHAPC|nr:hypothetical protein BY996DRAFT_6740111 [Phakopsora pachyrhizi]CAH7669894.1 hypothetical protein PPACK8108_LOCUS4548 [Phakopsora pachyrhizi]